MSRFSTEWLTLRERYDLVARNPDVREAVNASLDSIASVHVLDLACGSGSTMRALHRHFPARQHWALVDNDAELLRLARDGNPDKGVTLNTVRLDLNRDLDTAFETTIDLITTSALLDLVSRTWLNRFLRKVTIRSLPVYAALTYDGRTELSPADPFDTAIITAVNAHQRTDKGFGPALGPSAATSAIADFESAGYSVVHGESDWIIGPDDRAIQNELLAGWASAARDMAPPSDGTLTDTDIASWLARRGAAISEGLSSMRVGHVDFFASPSATR